MSGLPEFVLDREFDAPRELIWRASTWSSGYTIIDELLAKQRAVKP